MDFQFAPADESFRLEVRAFVAKNLPTGMAARTRLGYHPLKEDMRAWAKILWKKGWSAPNWPEEFGGPGWSHLQQFIFDEECIVAGAPPISWLGVRHVAPVIYTFGTAEQKARFLPPIRSGDAFWGQCFSEPNAGSDLASLRTSAIRDGDDYIVNGHKIWQTEGHFADWFFALVRTNPEERPQKGITFLLIDARAPGITIKPIISIDEAHSLNEVFLDNVRVPIANRIGEEGQGWTFAKFLLQNERTSNAEVPRSKRNLARLKGIVGATAESSELGPDFESRVAEVEIELLALETAVLRVLADQEAGRGNLAGASVLKIAGSEIYLRIGELTMEALGREAVPFYEERVSLASVEAPGAENGAAGVVSDFLYRRAMKIYGGSNEIQKDIIANQILGR